MLILSLVLAQYPKWVFLSEFGLNDMSLVKLIFLYVCGLVWFDLGDKTKTANRIAWLNEKLVWIYPNQTRFCQISISVGSIYGFLLNLFDLKAHKVIHT